MNNLKWLEKWYQHNCDGSWEHFYGIKIETLDNPGWHVKIELNETDYTDLQADEVSWDKGKDNWIKCFISNGIFNGFGDCMKLEMIIEIFKEWVENKNKKIL